MTAPAPTSSTVLTSENAGATILLKLGEIGAQIAVIHEQLKAVPDHEARIRSLERFKFSLLGASAGISALVSALGTWIGIAVSRR